MTPVLGSAPVDDARKYKDADEIAAMRRASQINDQVVEAAIAAVKAGAVESELAAYVEGLYRQHGADRSGEGRWSASAPTAPIPTTPPTGRCSGTGTAWSWTFSSPSGATGAT